MFTIRRLRDFSGPGVSILDGDTLKVCATAMISLSKTRNGDTTVTQQQTSPAVYLDHWALLDFAEDLKLSNRLTEILKARGGTLVVSWANLAEFSKVTSGEQARKAESLIDASLPRVFFIEADPFVVIDRENKLLKGGPHVAPHADPEFLKAFALLKPRSLTSRDLFAVIQGQSFSDRMDRLADTFISRIEAMRDELGTDSKLRANVGRSATASPIPRATRDILYELVRALIVDKQTKITRNHAIDFFHAVVPVSYCHLVLLDKYWETQVDRVRSRFRKASISVPIASVFSRKRNGVERFICQLESRDI